MTYHRKFLAATTTLALCVTAPMAIASSEGTDTQATAGAEADMSVRKELYDVYEALADYTAEQRDEAISAARSGLEVADNAIERRAEALRNGWAEMSEDARETARAELADLREARMELAEQLGALQTASSDAWNAVKDGFVAGYRDLSDALSS
ncbi:hypothetical protein [Aestuariivita boseongensis]|uniref:hypothetical protein n=1 Tax=Aestuariivita boseongensis TaxID=1470562 RepID=UPI000680DAF6|nr:hypothetical protein [Aestuariivita boseongensis]